MASRQARSREGSCYRGDAHRSRPADSLASGQGVVEGLVPVSGVTLAFAAIMFAVGLVLVFILSMVIAKWHLESKVWKPTDYDDL